MCREWRERKWGDDMIIQGEQNGMGREAIPHLVEAGFFSRLQVPETRGKSLEQIEREMALS